jgi:hypothetical protein
MYIVYAMTGKIMNDVDDVLRIKRRAGYKPALSIMVKEINLFIFEFMTCEGLTPSYCGAGLYH